MLKALVFQLIESTVLSSHRPSVSNINLYLYTKGIAVPHVVTCVVEHPAILECLSAMQAQGRITYTAVDSGATTGASSTPA